MSEYEKEVTETEVTNSPKSAKIDERGRDAGWDDPITDTDVDATSDRTCNNGW